MNFLRKKWQEYRAHHELRKIITNMNWLFFDMAIRMVVSFFVGVAVVRYLGPERFGVLSYSVAIVMFFGTLSKLGLDVITVRELVDKKDQEVNILGTVFYLKMISGSACCILATVTAFFLKNDTLITLITLLASFSLMFQAMDVIDFWFQSRVASKYVAYVRTAACIFSALIKIYLIHAEASLVWFAGIISVEAFFVAIGFIIAYFKNKDKKQKWIFDVCIARALFKDAWPLILASVATMVYLRIDQIMIGNILGYKSLGQYSVAVNLSEAWYFIPAIIAGSVFPAIIITKKRSEKKYHERLQNLYDMMVWMAIAIALPMTFLSGWIVNFLYGAEYTQASGVLMIYVWAGIFVFLSVASGKWYVAEKLQSFLLLFATSGALLNIALNYILIKKIGMNGAAWATLISYFFSMYLVSSFFTKTRVNFIKLSKSLSLLRLFKKLIRNIAA